MVFSTVPNFTLIGAACHLHRAKSHKTDLGLN